MRIIKSLDELDNSNLSFALTMGNFDGVHHGHRHILKKIISSSEKEDLELVVVTFLPHPIQILNPKKDFLINSLEERRCLLESVGVKYLLEIDFTRDVSLLSPLEFLTSFFRGKGLRKIFLGHDFAFGANKSGNAQVVKDFCLSKGIGVTILNKCEVNNENVSSSTIRALLKKGNIEKVNKLLERNFFVSGRVVKGEGRGKQIGFPTANIDLSQDRIVPKIGVYLTSTSIGGQQFDSVTNVGRNPTFNDDMKLFVETYIFDFDENIYGDQIKVEFVTFIRDEKKFSSVDDLVNQISIDVKFAREKLLHERN